MQFNINPELESLINTRVASGMSHSADEVLRDALYMLAERDLLWQDNRDLLEEKLKAAEGEIARGEVLTEAELMQHIEKRKAAFFSTS